MSYTLFDLTHRVAKELKIVVDGVATGGTTGTLLDSNDRTEADNYWADGSLWLWYDAGALSAAPEGEMSVLNSSTSSGGVLTFRDAFSAAPASGDKYSVARKVRANIPWMPIIIQNVNSALQELGTIPVVDVTSVTMASAQTEYSTVPIRAYQDLRQVLIQRVTTDADNNYWQELTNYELTPATPGNAPTLRLPIQYASGYDLMLVYLDYHPEMQIAADVLNDNVPIERVVYPAALECLEWLRELWNGDAKYDRAIERVQQKVVMAEARYPVKKPKKIGKVMLVDWPTRYPERHEFEVNKVYL